MAQPRSALRTLQEDLVALTWSKRGLLNEAVRRSEEAQRLLAPLPAPLQA